MKYREVGVISGTNRVSTAVFDPHGQGEVTKIAVLTPGFLDSKDYPDMTELGSALSERGFLAASFDPTGTWKSEGTMNEYSASEILRNMRSVADYLKNQAGNIPREMVVLGHSLGAMLSIIFGSKQLDVSGVVSIMPPQSFVRPENLRAKIRPWKKAGIKRSTRDLPDNPNILREFEVPYSFVEDVVSYDALVAVGLIRVPTLLMVGTLDEIITPNHVKPIYDAANYPKELIVLENVGHDYRKIPRDIQTVNSLVVRFLQSHSL